MLNFFIILDIYGTYTKRTSGATKNEITKEEFVREEGKE